MRWNEPDKSDKRWKMIESLNAQAINALNAQAAQEYQRLQNRLRAEQEPGWAIETAQWPFPLTGDDLAFLKINKIRA